jgi:hypothetical protein
MRNLENVFIEPCLAMRHNILHDELRNKFRIKVYLKCLSVHMHNIIEFMNICIIRKNTIQITIRHRNVIYRRHYGLVETRVKHLTTVMSDIKPNILSR